MTIIDRGLFVKRRGAHGARPELRWWTKLLLWAVLPALAGAGAGYVGGHLPAPSPIFALFLKEASHFLVVVAWVGAGMVMATHALHEIVDHMGPEIAGEMSTAIRDVGREILSDAKGKIVPEFGGAMSAAIRDLGPVLAECIKQKDFFTDLLPRTAQIEPQPLLGTDPELTNAKKLFEEGKIAEAIKRLTDLAAKEPRYRSDLLNVLIYSTDDSDWETAIKLLPEVGTVASYNRLAFKMWAVERGPEAINLAEEAVKRSTQVGTDPTDRARAKNNLAYFLAHFARAERREEAMRLATEALGELRELLKNGSPSVPPQAEGKFISTLGYVHIEFAQDLRGIIEGMKVCQEGIERGASPDLHFRHMDRARARMAELKRSAPTSQSDLV